MQASGISCSLAQHTAGLHVITDAVTLTDNRTLTDDMALTDDW